MASRSSAHALRPAQAQFSIESPQPADIRRQRVQESPWPISFPQSLRFWIPVLPEPEAIGLLPGSSQEVGGWRDLLTTPLVDSSCSAISPNDRILRYDEVSERTEVFLTPAGFTNGRTVGRQGRFVTCEHG